MTDDTTPTGPNPAAGLCPMWWLTATMALFAGLLFAVIGGIFGWWPMIGAATVLLVYGSYCARLVIFVSAQNATKDAVSDGISMLAALRSQGN